LALIALCRVRTHAHIALSRLSSERATPLR
jgi:hypothetical protein